MQPRAEPALRRLEFADVESAIPLFTADNTYNVHKWLDDYEDIITSMQGDARLKFLYARRLMAGTAKMFLRTASITTWEELKAALINEFGQRFTRQDIYQQLSRRRIHRDEAVRRYVLHMQEIASHVDVDEFELVQFIIDGLDDRSANVTILYSAKNLKELKELLVTYERRRSKPAAPSAPAARQPVNPGPSVPATTSKPATSAAQSQSPT